MNYLLHNMGYDKPINFREIVLRMYHKNCIWLRDTNFSRLDLYNYEEWLPDIQYEYRQLNAAQERVTKTQNELASLTDDKLQAMYELEVEKIKSLHRCEHSYHVDMAESANKCAYAYNKHLKKWLDLPDTPKWLTNELVDIYDTAMRDVREHQEEDSKAVERMHDTPTPTFEQFKIDTIERIKSHIEFNKDRVKDAKKAIKIIQKEIEDVKQIFAWLDEIEQEENHCENM